uniref:Uncharacterized protein n=2 Tax=Anguilla anguilla TaxID=7936 RepID=A0A0E9U9L2_ANGAN
MTVHMEPHKLCSVSLREGTNLFIMIRVNVIFQHYELNKMNLLSPPSFKQRMFSFSLSHRANDGCLYVFDREQNKRTLKVRCV